MELRNTVGETGLGIDIRGWVLSMLILKDRLLPKKWRR